VLLSCLAACCLQVKKGPLQETSPMLCDIAQVPNWVKVCAQFTCACNSICCT
jgi:hypothetical protein